MGQHVAENMRTLKDESPEIYERQFSQYIKNGLDADKIEAMYMDAHAAIRKDPSFTKKEAKTYEAKKRFTRKAFNRKERRERIRQKKAHYLAQLQKELAVVGE